ncbi:MAG: SDR family oxidoreductase, partial [Chloroflexi bacterium]|nr:SDR family oxidoreductase [Chloroflexota bacterium]
REVVKQLAAAGIKVRAAVHIASKGEVFKRLGIETVEMDYARPETWAAAFNGAAKVFFVGFAGPTFADLSRNFAEAARKAGIAHFVKLSAFGADFAPQFYIAKSHRESEEAIESTGIAYTHLRPNVFMQNLINYYGQAIRDTGRFYLAQGDGKVSFIDVRDVAVAAVETLTSGSHAHAGKSYTLTGSEALSYYQVAEILSRVTGKTIEYVALSEEHALQQSRASGAPEFLMQVHKTMDAFGRSGGFAPVNSVYQQITNRQPVRFEQFARDYAEAFK